MSKLIDFYKKAESDPALRADLEAAKKRYEGQIPGRETIVAEGIALAAKHGVTLEPADFEFKKGELDEEDLSDVSGGFLPLLAIIIPSFVVAATPAGVGIGMNAC
ncbi:hypothetical protein AGMMS49928_28930 [Spirochaetia bacterium]|nr:hypothetical protein AGMMS49928_28930 [Spirochaetia bacterium]